MIYLVSFWGLLAKPVDLWGELKASVEILKPGGESSLEPIIAVVERIREANYEVPLRAVLRAVARQISADETELGRIYVRRVLERLEPATCALEFAKWAAARGKLAIVSNTPCRCFVKHFIDTHGVQAEAVFTSDVLMRRKPHKSVFRYALKKLRAQPHEAVYIGDSEDDLGAMAAGLLTIIIGREGGHASFNDVCEAAEWLNTLYEKNL